MRLLVGIPALNEEDTIRHVIDEIPSSMPGITDISVCVIDDASTDATASMAREAGARVISNARTCGVATAFRRLVRVALEDNSDILVNIDGDGQFSPSEIPGLIEPIVHDRADFVAANRFGSTNERPKDMPLGKYFGNRAMNWLLQFLTGRQFSDVSSGFRAYSRHALLHLNVLSGFTYTQETFLDLATKDVRIAQVPVDVHYLPGRQSRVVKSLLRYGIRTLSTIFRVVRDNRPLTVFGLPAAMLCLAGIALGTFLAVHYFRTGAFTPYIFVGFVGAYVFTIGLVLAIVGLASDMLRPIRRNQELMLYLVKRQAYRPTEPANSFDIHPKGEDRRSH